MGTDRAQNSKWLDRCDYKLPLQTLPWVTQAGQLPSLSLAPGLLAGRYYPCSPGSSGGFGEKNVESPLHSGEQLQAGTSSAGYPEYCAFLKVHMLQLQAD